MVQSSGGDDKEKEEEIQNRLVSILVLDCYNTISEDRAVNVNFNSFKTITNK